MFIQHSGNRNFKDICIFPHSDVIKVIVSINSINFQFVFILLLSSNPKLYSDLCRLTINK